MSVVDRVVAWAEALSARARRREREKFKRGMVEALNLLAEAEEEAWREFGGRPTRPKGAYGLAQFNASSRR